MSSIIVEEWRDMWSFKADFLVAAIAWAFSNTNFVRLPQDIATYGGCTFLVAYGASLLVCCLPLIVMELAVGQLTGRAPVQAIYNMCPLFKGVGVAQLVYSLAWMSMLGIRLSYYLLHIFWLLWSLIDPNSDGNIPWLRCAGGSVGEGVALIDDNEGSGTWTTTNLSIVSSPASPYATCSPNAPALYLKSLTNVSVDIGHPEQFEWRLVAALGVVWILVLFAVFAGVRWLGKVFYVTLLVPITLMAALLVRASTLHYAYADQILLLFTPDWNKLLLTDLWVRAFSQSIYATGVGFGAYITLGSYNKRNNNLVCDSFLIVISHIIGVALSIYLSIGFIGFAIDGKDIVVELAVMTPLDLWNRLLFVQGSLPLSTVWTFFLLFMVVGFMLNALYMLTLSILASMEDCLGEGASRCLPRLGLAILICIFGFAVGLGLTTRSGPYALSLMETFLDQLTLWVIIVFEVLAVAWFYCGHLLGHDLRQMISNRCCWVFGYIFVYLLYVVAAAPVYILVMKLLAYDFGYLDLGPGVIDVQWSEAVGWAVAVVPILPIPIFMIYIITRTCIKGPGITYWQRFKYTVISPLRYEVVKPSPPPRYTASAPGYVLLPQAPLAEPEAYGNPAEMYGDRIVRVSNI